MERTDQELVRIEKANRIREMGMDPFGHRFDRTHSSEDIREQYSKYEHDELEKLEDKVTIAGRIMFIRKMGKASFFSIQDKTGKMQVYISINDVGEETYNLFKTADIGDIVGVTGKVMKTKTGELTVKCLEYTHLVKALRPLPEKFHGLTDIEERYRRRYVDLIMNEDSKKTAFLRPRIIRCIQNYMDGLGFVEVETPVLTTLLTGASARPFCTHHNAQDLDMYLRIALELPLKRLLVGGMEAVYEIGRVFRNEGMDTRHNPEFTEMEAYLAYSNLDGMMDMTEGMFQTIAREVFGRMTFNWCGNEINLEGPWKRISMVEAIKEQTGIDFKKDMSVEEALKLAEEHHIEVEEHEKSFGHIVNLFFEKYVEEIIQSSREDILDLPVHNSEFYLQDLLSKVMNVYAEQCALRHIDLKLGDFENRLLKGDIERCQEVLENLFENAFKYGDGRRIEVSFYEEDYCQLIRLFSSGSTVTDNEFNHLFESFFRGTNAKGMKGSGLGLYICKELMQKMDGTIFAEKCEDGMAFIMVLR